jgi:hypothetical protein
MSEHKTKTGIKGDGYKALQLKSLPGKYSIVAVLSEKWMRRHGFVKKEQVADSDLK